MIEPEFLQVSLQSFTGSAMALTTPATPCALMYAYDTAHRAHIGVVGQLYIAAGSQLKRVTNIYKFINITIYG